MTTNTMMNTWTDGAETGPSLLARIAAPLTVFGSVRRSLRLRYEMSRLTDRNLADMGLVRGDIRRIARGEIVQRQQVEV